MAVSPATDSKMSESLAESPLWDNELATRLPTREPKYVVRRRPRRGLPAKLIKPA